MSPLAFPLHLVRTPAVMPRSAALPPLHGQRPLGPWHIAFLAPKIYPVLCEDPTIGFAGGAEVQQTQQILGLRRAGHRITVLTDDQGQAPEVWHRGVRVKSLPREGGRGWPGLRYVYPRTWDRVRALAAINPDLVFVQTASEEVTAAAFYGRFWGKPWVFAGASDTDFSRGALPGMPAHHTAVYRRALYMAHAIVVQNQHQQGELQRHWGRAGHLVHNGFEDPLAQPARFQGPVLWVASLRTVKQPMRFVELARRHPELRWVMVGGPDSSHASQQLWRLLQAQARTLPQLELVGHVPFAQVGRVFDGAAVLVNTSDVEGLPNTFVQAWLRGMPTVSLVRPESAPGATGTWSCRDLDEIEATVLRLVRDERSWKAASHAARSHYQRHHTLEQATRDYEALFAQLLNR